MAKALEAAKNTATTPTTNNNPNPDAVPQIPEALAGLNLTAEERKDLAALNTVKLDTEDFEKISKFFDGKGHFFHNKRKFKYETGIILGWFQNKYAGTKGGEFGIIRRAMGFKHSQQALDWIEAARQVREHGKDHIAAFFPCSLSDDYLPKTANGKDPKKAAAPKKTTAWDKAHFTATFLVTDVVQKLQEVKQNDKVQYQLAVNKFADEVAERGPAHVLRVLQQGSIHEARAGQAAAQSVPE